MEKRPNVERIADVVGGVLPGTTDADARHIAEFIEMPGLRLTREQAQRLWGLDRAACDTLLGKLVDAKFLFRTRDGAFVSSTDARQKARHYGGVVTSPAVRTYKAHDINMMFHESFSADEVVEIVSAVGDYIRACEGSGLTLQRDNDAPPSRDKRG